MADKNIAIDTNAASKVAAEALEKSAQPLGGSVATDEDDLFADMMEQAEAEADADNIFDE
jgi:hypothetical protein